MSVNVDKNSNPAGPILPDRPDLSQATEQVRISEASLPEILRTDSLAGQTTEKPVDTSVKPAGPTLNPSYPTIPAANLSATVTSLAQQISENPFFQPSVVTVLMGILNQVMSFDRDTRYLEAQTELKSRQVSIDLSQTNAQLTKDAFDKQADAKRMEAIGAFISAAIAGITAIATIGSAARADKQAREQVEKEITAQKDQVESLKKELAGEEIVSHDPKKATETVRKDLTPEQIETKTNELKYAQDKLEKLKAKAESNIVSVAGQRQIELQRQGEMYSKIMQDIASGVEKSISAGLTQEEGALRALHEANEGFLAALRTYLENSARARDDAKNNLDKFADFLNRAIDANYSHVFGRG